jgi:N utilization substance protein B
MDSPHKIRELALQVLFAFDSQNAASEEMAQEVTLNVAPDHAVVRRVTNMAMAAWEARTSSDEWTTRLAPQWPSHRQPALDRAILRLAIWELTSTDTPPKVVIDEAIELAKSFSTASSPSFVNGVLDAVHKEILKLKGE